MSVSVKYKNNEIVALSETGTKTLLTSGKYCEADIVVENTKDGIDTSDATAVASDIKSGKTAYVDGAKVTGTLANTTQATPTISVSSSGLITASATQSAGVVSAGTKSATKQLTTQGTKTVTPSTSNQTAVASGRYTTGAVTVKGDSNLKAENIKKDVSIFGVTGTLDSGGSSGGGSRETWVFNENGVSLNIGYQFDVAFESNGQRFTGILGNGDVYISNLNHPLLYLGDSPQQVGYVTNNGDAYFDAVWRKITIEDTTSEGYEILAERVLNEVNSDYEPNAVKQPSDVAVQTDKTLTITSNGTTNITPDVPYDAMSKVAVTVNVPGIVWVDPD